MDATSVAILLTAFALRRVPSCAVPGHVVAPRRCHQRVRKTPAAPAGLLSLACVAAPWQRAGCEQVLCCDRRARRARSNFSSERYGASAVPSCRMSSLSLTRSRQCCHRRVRKVPAAPAGLTALASDTAPCQRAGRVRLQRRHQRVQKVPAAPVGLHLARAMWRRATVPVVTADSAAASASGKRCSASRSTSLTGTAVPCHRTGCDHLQCCHQRVRQVQAALACPAAHRPDISHERCSALPSCRLCWITVRPSACAK